LTPRIDFIRKHAVGNHEGDLLAMSDWLVAQGVTHVATESTGVIWKPIYNFLEGRFTVLLVDARE